MTEAEAADAETAEADGRYVLSTRGRIRVDGLKERAKKKEWLLHFNSVYTRAQLISSQSQTLPIMGTS